MKILIVSTNDIKGGASRATYRLYESLLKNKIDCKMLVATKTLVDDNIISSSSLFFMIRSRLSYLFDSFPTRFYLKRSKRFFSNNIISFNGIVKKINSMNPDIVHFHWVGNGFFRIKDINKIKAPIVWSLHDNWLFTGGCHIMLDCEKYKSECKCCPNLGSNSVYDLSKINFNIKRKTFKNQNDLTIIGLSKWIYSCSKNSYLLKDKKHFNIPNPIDTESFKPKNKAISRKKLGLPEQKKLILFGAFDVTADFNKGFYLLIKALEMIDDFEVELVVFGRADHEHLEKIKLKTHYLGYIGDDEKLINIYNSSDLIIVPSLQENLSNTIMEAQSCGLPVVAFNVCGNSDLVEHLKTGYLAKPFEYKDLKNGIDWILNNKSHDLICQNSRKKIKNEFESNKVARRYIKVYNNILNSKFN